MVSILTMRGMDRAAIAGMMQRNFGSGFGYRCS